MLEEPSSAPRFADMGPLLPVSECLLKMQQPRSSGTSE